VNFLKTLSIVAFASTLVACAHVAPQYSASVSNVDQLRGAAQTSTQKLSITPFGTYKTGLKSIFCRGEGPVETPNGKPFEKYIEEAMSSEVRLSGLYDENSSNKIEGKLDLIDFSSNIGSGKWMINMSISGPNIAPYRVETVYSFSTNFIANLACEQVAQAFPIAVKNVVTEIISHPNFKSAFHKNKDS
jgi:hypothetical protein